MIAWVTFDIGGGGLGSGFDVGILQLIYLY